MDVVLTPSGAHRRWSGAGREARTGRRGAFTLVETLAVMAVLAVLAAVTLPAVSSLSRNSSRRSAVNLVLSTLDQVRGMAITQNGNFFLALADSNPDWPENYRSRSFAIFQEEYQSKTGRYNILPVTGWTVLPEGISFKPDADTIFANTTTETFYCQPASKELKLVFFKFNTTGSLDEPANSTFARLRLFEGTLNKAGNVVSTNNAKQAREEVVTLSLTTGRAKREEDIPKTNL